jgi:hypothetical protein
LEDACGFYLYVKNSIQIDLLNQIAPLFTENVVSYILRCKTLFHLGAHYNELIMQHIFRRRLVLCLQCYVDPTTIEWWNNAQVWLYAVLQLARWVDVEGNVAICLIRQI